MFIWQLVICPNIEITTISKMGIGERWGYYKNHQRIILCTDVNNSISILPPETARLTCWLRHRPLNQSRT